MSEQEQALAKREPAPIAMGDAGLKLATMEEAYRFCKYIVASGVAPKGDTAETVLVKLQAGAELGIPPIRALSTLCVINGRLSIMGEAALAKIRSARCCSVLDVFNEGEGDERAGVLRFQRVDMDEPREVRFTMADAKRAGMAGGNQYRSYADDMLIWRAVSRAAKRYFSDVMMGFDVAEVVREYAAEPVALPAPLPPAEPDPLLAEVEDDPFGPSEHTEAP